jgi:hypothetical protein
MKEHAEPVNVEEATSLNLVPMVDILLQMLLSFVLGSDMGLRELEDVALPPATTVRPDKSDDAPPPPHDRQCLPLPPPRRRLLRPRFDDRRRSRQRRDLP